MPRIWQLLFLASVLASSWLAMMGLHELGHVLGAWLTGGVVTEVIWHPLAISRTEVSPNPSPGVVVWSGPLLGCLVPVLVLAATPARQRVARPVAAFFAGFCLIANGLYIGVGVFGQVGDCRVMLQTGTPRWVLWAFGLVGVASGGWLWHRLGSIAAFVRDPGQVSAAMFLTATATFLTLAAGGVVLSFFIQ